MSETMTISSLDDAMDFINNSAIANWPWSGNASSQGFGEYLLTNHQQVDKEDFTVELKGYLLSMGEDPTMYGLF
ncbi:MAG: hypothetical protein OEM02_05580 [Desulfobulbaceae bacterium]|nr:hypothetical protein [Desulfobulbaceae bacterium]